jgi:hypothetical protein
VLLPASTADFGIDGSPLRSVTRHEPVRQRRSPLRSDEGAGEQFAQVSHLCRIRRGGSGGIVDFDDEQRARL